MLVTIVLDNDRLIRDRLLGLCPAAFWEEFENGPFGDANSRNTRERPNTRDTELEKTTAILLDDQITVPTVSLACDSRHVKN